MTKYMIDSIDSVTLTDKNSGEVIAEINYNDKSLSPVEEFLNTYYATQGLTLDDQLAALFVGNTNAQDQIAALVNMIREINANVG